MAPRRWSLRTTSSRTSALDEALQRGTDAHEDGLALLKRRKERDLELDRLPPDLEEVLPHLVQVRAEGDDERRLPAGEHLGHLVRRRGLGNARSEAVRERLGGHESDSGPAEALNQRLHPLT